MQPRPVRTIVNAPQQTEGAGFTVRRPIPSAGLDPLDPILLLDELGPITYAPGAARGAPDHPHRGFETVTYLLDGEAEHADSAGHAGSLGPGDVQWMTAGAGVVHREMPSRRLQREGGRMHGFQLWVNLPAAEKRIPPCYQEVRASAIPTATTPDGRATARVIAGQALGVAAVIATRTPVVYHHWSFAAGAAVRLPLPADHQVGVYVFDGSLKVAGAAVSRGQLAVLGDGDAVDFAADAPAQALLIGGRPLREPIAWGGPFVMNTREEVLEAYADHRAGRMGRIPPGIIRA
jgi:redox-sensitive bicupin YhaK (pirin superfamily)